MNRFRRALVGTVLGFILILGAQAAVQNKTIEYRDGEVVLKGHLYWDDALSGKRPGIIVVHEWWGLNDYARQRAGELATLGYAAFAIDMYGDSKVTQHGAQAKEWMQQITANLENWRRRALLGLDVLRHQEQVDPKQMAAIGYCFGGATVMQMAYSGADLAGVVSFHGSLPSPGAEDMGRIKAKILVEHGGADSFVPAERVSQFQQAMEQAKADWTFVVHGGATHSFTNPEAAKAGIPGLNYSPTADHRSWQDMRDFFHELFPAK